MSKSELEVLEDINNLLNSEKNNEHNLGSEGKFKKVNEAFILPFGNGRAYSIDSRGRVSGVKLGRIENNIGKILELICELVHVKRIVIFGGVTYDIPDKFLKLTELEFLWVGGAINRLPQHLFSLLSPITAVRTASDAAFNSFLSKDLLDTFTPTSLEGDSIKTRRKKSQKNLNSEIHMLTEETIEDSPFQLEILDELQRASGLYVVSDTLSDPPFEILLHGADAINNYYIERAKQSLPLNELKVILVGNGGAGKTSLVKRLMGERFDAKEKQTHGINIKKWALSTNDGVEVKLNFWDFGGQQIMHATHQFFLSKRSVYILVLDGRKEEDPEYWLQHITSFGGDSPVFVVLNKVDEHPSFGANEKFLREKYKNILGFYRISCSKHMGVDALIGDMKSNLSDIPMIKTQWPYSWFQVKKELEEKGTEFITLDQYRNICSKHDVPAESQEILVDFLHDLGIVLHFRDIQLLDMHVLDPRWVTEGVYRIINSKKLAEQNGVLKLDALTDVLKYKKGLVFTYPPEKHSFLVDLMVKFEVCYRLSSDSILIPDLLDVQEPQFYFDDSDALKFVFEYDYLPKSVMLRLIVRLHADINNMERWRTGVVLHSETFSTKALIKADEKAKRIYVTVAGLEKRDYFAVIRRTIFEINISFEKLGFREKVPLPDESGHMVDYADLIGHERKGIEEMFIGRLDRSFNVQKLLNGVEKKSSRDSSQTINVHGNYFAANTNVQTVIGNIGNTEEASMTQHTVNTWEKIIVTFSLVLFLALFGYLLVRNTPIDSSLMVAFRIVMSLLVAVFGATVPGYINVGFSAKGLTVRAAGAIALFVLTYVYTPGI
ncbi:COR domain-containing protein [Pseudomonas sp. Au-Pse12]|uniref:COR domain-containing protein n=1 Tax=Pseudomonas sp. Au-Pse12 TaxID=2906459 RepID=UPI001E424989|nr:COR domain-containing protein [Pseudomonas sp. Au-Pse12]MCE4058566.1 GTP-binding protein [Pseudomonas sp. Au-Pse12]